MASRQAHSGKAQSVMWQRQGGGGGCQGLDKGYYPRAGLRVMSSTHTQKAGAFKDASYSWGPWAGPH